MAATDLEHIYPKPSLHNHAPRLGGEMSTRPEPTLPTTITIASSQSLEAAKDILFGSIAGMCGKFIEYPFDTVKVRLQSHVPTPTSPAYRGPLECFVRSYRYDGGLASLYRGISAPLVGAAIENSSLFFSYRIAQEAMVWALPEFAHDANEHTKNSLPLSALLACGAASGAFTSLLLTPIELIKCRMQAPTGVSTLAHSRPGPLSHVVSIFRNEGLLGFWHGQLGTLIRETGGSAAWFGSYEGVCNAFRKYSKVDGGESGQLPVYQQMCAGATAGMSYNFIFYPADTIKSRMQTEDVSATVKPGRTMARRQTFGSTGRAIWREHGLRGFYRGCGITVARSAPSSAFIFSIYEGLRAYVD